MEEPQMPPPPMPPAKTPVEADIAENKDLAALSYVWILALVVHFSAHNSPFAKFHCRQGLVLFALSIVGSLINGVLGTLLLLIILALSVLGFLNAAQGLKKDLPVIGPLARADLQGMSKHLKDGLDMVRKLWKRTAKKTQPEKPKPAPAPTVPTASPVASTPPAPTPEPPKPVEATPVPQEPKPATVPTEPPPPLTPPVS